LRSVAASENNARLAKVSAERFEAAEKESGSFATGFEFGEERRRVALGKVEGFAPGIDDATPRRAGVIENFINVRKS